jgi:glyoxylase-like metal-dependent hydrolase (beta-lactamase superfamily II)
VKELTLQLVDTGFCRHPEAMTTKAGSWRPALFPALVGVIRHPDEGVVLFDTGYDPLFIAATEPFPERLYRWLTPPTISNPIADHLTSEGVDPATVRHVVLSHFHGDHVSGLRRFSDARVHCARAGLRSVWKRGRIRALTAGTPVRLLPPDLPTRCNFFEDQSFVRLPADLAPFAEGADLLGDGSMLAVPLPGHCPGHWGLVLREPRGLHFLVADAAWSSRAIRDNRPPPRITSALLGDTVAGRQTLNQLHQLRLHNPDLLITPSHCSERMRADCS